jgi:hypothetical protein
MILETLEVHNSPNSRLFGLRPTVAAGFSSPRTDLAWHFRYPLPIVALTEVFLGAKAVDRA